MTNCTYIGEMTFSHLPKPLLERVFDPFLLGLRSPQWRHIIGVGIAIGIGIDISDSDPAGQQDFPLGRTDGEGGRLPLT